LKTENAQQLKSYWCTREGAQFFTGVGRNQIKSHTHARTHSRMQMHKLHKRH